MSPDLASRPQAVAQALGALAADPRVRQAQEALREASTRLRWNEVLRRRWREARAEAAVRGAIASAAVEGAVVPASTLRQAVAAGELVTSRTADPSLDVAAGLWRAQTRLAQWMAPLRGTDRPVVPTPAALLATLHRDVVGPLAASGRLPLAEVGAARLESQEAREGGPGPAAQGEELHHRRRSIIELIDLEGAPALVRCAVVHAETACARPFTAGNAAVGRLLARHLAVRDGLEPTGTAVPDLYPARAPRAYADALAAYATGSPDGVVTWIVWQAEALLMGVQEAEELCRAVQAGTTAAG
ncbi:Fic family protein [Actinomyces faecalis]|uniref:Fic family protein n=1 Tax=Actinomyces faecalis TaxID=2722820 RepID=UPI001557C22A|nr:Fic family protein [Actinomyces faecalis]